MRRELGLNLCAYDLSSGARNAYGDRLGDLEFTTTAPGGFGPFYAVALYAFLRGRDWIRIPSLLWAAVLMTNVTIILGEELAGPHATPQPAMVILANLPWLLVPAAAIARMARREHPFTEAVAAGL